MKVKTKNLSVNEVNALPLEKRVKPKKPSWLFRTLVRILSYGDLKKTHFTYEKTNFDKIKKGQPCLVLMNHSSFIDVKIASKILKDTPYNIVSTTDGSVGKKWLMRQLGCIFTNKYVTDIALVKDINYCLHTLKTSVLMYPEASYSMDGRQGLIPTSIGKLIKMLKVPVITIITDGAFLRDPLYNNLQLRKVNISAKVDVTLTEEMVEKLTPSEINDIIFEKFTFDAFLNQQKNNVKINEPFRADSLERVLYKCPNCNDEFSMQGSGVNLTCNNCKKQYILTENGTMQALNGQTEFTQISSWVDYQKDCVKKEIENKTYSFNERVKIAILKGSKCLYFVGEGNLVHNESGFTLNSDDNLINFNQPPLATHTANCDYYWYELGDVIAIGNEKILYYTFPINQKVPVYKVKLATEEIYKKAKSQITK